MSEQQANNPNPPTAERLSKEERLEKLEEAHVIDTDAIATALEPLVNNKGSTAPEQTRNTTFKHMVEVMKKASTYAHGRFEIEITEIEMDFGATGWIDNQEREQLMKVVKSWKKEGAAVLKKIEKRIEQAAKEMEKIIAKPYPPGTLEKIGRGVKKVTPGL